jgi:hypothetical protein
VKVTKINPTFSTSVAVFELRDFLSYTTSLACSWLHIRNHLLQVKSPFCCYTHKWFTTTKCLHLVHFSRRLAFEICCWSFVYLHKVWEVNGIRCDNMLGIVLYMSYGIHTAQHAVIGCRLLSVTTWLFIRLGQLQINSVSLLVYFMSGLFIGADRMISIKFVTVGGTIQALFD